MITPASQSAEFFAAFAAGGVAALCYNLLWYARYAFSFKMWATLTADLIFGVCAVGGLFYAVQLSAHGAMRIYHILGFMCGFTVINFPFKRYIRNFTLKLSAAVVRLYKKLQSLPLTKKIFK